MPRKDRFSWPRRFHVDRLVGLGDTPGVARIARSHKVSRLERDGVALRFTSDLPERAGHEPPPGYIEMSDVRRLWRAGEIGAEELLCGLLEFAGRDREGYERSVEGPDAVEVPDGDKGEDGRA